MNFKLFSNYKVNENAKLVIIVLLFISMILMFVNYTEIKLGSLGILGVAQSNEFPSDKMWIFSGSSNRSSYDESSSPYVFPTSITFRYNMTTYSVDKQKSTLINVYNDIVQYVCEFLGPQYNAVPISYNEYIKVLKNNNFALLSYDSPLSAYMLRLYCDRDANSFYSGIPCNISKLLLTEDINGRLIAYTSGSDGEVMKFTPHSDAQAAAYPINSAVISAYNNSKMLSPSIMSFESEFFSSPQISIAPDIAFQNNLQFYEAGISNPLTFIGGLTSGDSLIKNDKILSILKSFKMNTGLVKHYTEQNVIFFVESSASLALSADGYMTYNDEGGGIPLSKILEKTAENFSVSDKLSAATALIGEFGNDTIGGNGEVMLSAIRYDNEKGIIKFEFSYCFDSVPFHGLDKIELEISENSVIRAHIPTYSIYRNSVRKSDIIPPEVAFSATPIQDKRVKDYKTGYIVEKNGITANVGWIAVT